MKKIGIYIMSDNKAWGRRHRSTFCLLEYTGRRGTVTRDFVIETDETFRGAAIRALAEAAGRIDEPVHAAVFCDDGGLEATVRELDALKERGFVRRDGKPIAYADQLKQISEGIAETEWGGSSHSYSEWMEGELMRRKQTCVS